MSADRRQYPSNEILSLVREFLAKLSQEVHLRAAFLFGSSVTGERTSESDVDLVVVADEFEGMRLSERFRIVYRHWPLEKYSADIFPLGPLEFERKKTRSIILRDASQYWIRVYPFETESSQ